MSNQKEQQKILEGNLDRRDLLVGAAGIAASVFGANQAIAGAHQSAPIELSAEDKMAKSVGEGAQILITGANRGLGFEFTRQYAARGAKIIATARSPERAEALNKLAADNANIVVEQLDVTDHARIDELAAKYVDTPIDLLLNNAGIGGGFENQLFGRMNYDTFDQVMAVNVKGPMKICEAFRKHVGASELRKMVTVSSSQGSIATVQSPMLYWYRASKSAVNMCMVNMKYQLEKKKIIIGMVTPGATATDFIPEPFRKMIKGIQTPEQATADMIRNIDRFSMANSGTFFDYTGEIVPW
jgi:NAD(P)-dependent dehydrogenase (short-subunit alcohol dehydrogenase family)